MKRFLTLLVTPAMLLSLLAGCGAREGSGSTTKGCDLYDSVMARFDGNLEEGAVIQVLENDTAIELGYVDELIAAFNEAYREQIPQNAWDAYAKDFSGETFYCGVPLNVQSGMLYYLESSLPENWKQDWDLNGNDVPDFFETYTALYAYSELCRQGGQPTQYGYLDETVDTYFMSGYLTTFGASAKWWARGIVILYFCLVKNIVNGLTAGAVKG